MRKRNPLRRTVDRLELIARAVAAVLALAAVPLSLAIGGLVREHDLATAATWQAPDGTPHAGQITAAVASGAAIAVCSGLLLVAARRRRDAVRNAAWATEWQHIEPLWTDRLPDPD